MRNSHFSLRHIYTHLCAGSILDESTILTSALLVASLSCSLPCSQVTRNLQVVASEHSLGTISGDEEQNHLVASILSNAAYDTNTKERDLAIFSVWPEVWSIFIIDFLIN